MKLTMHLSLAEKTEIEAYTNFMTGAPASVRERLGIASLDLGYATALLVKNDPSYFFNRVGGFSADRPPTADDVARAITFFRAHKIEQAAFMVAPPLAGPNWHEIVRKAELTPGRRYTKLVCDVRTLPGLPSGFPGLDPKLRIGPVSSADADEWGAVMMKGFGFSVPGMAENAAASVGRPNWQQYAIWDQSRIVATGSIFVDGECADMFGGATLPEARGRGAQSALLAVRILAAQEAGCRWIFAETGSEQPGEHNSSLHNMQRIGFRPLYERLTWLWRS
ncbi:GNAT family N-acetyltransferase [Streptomyces sp. NPDC093509]|uniref:GNAT family N-acetyltransferase n=1 Tax=Streptomyces sp. NPDC093509 TaxID=3154982 RepID=UPI00344E81B6